jgi:O-antigen/teichoic acid export membrane protein
MVALAMSGEMSIVARIGVWSSIVKLLLAGMFGYMLGGIGVAIASALATTIAKLAGWSAARRHLNVDTSMRLSFVGTGMKYVYRSLNTYMQRR